MEQMIMSECAVQAVHKCPSNLKIVAPGASASTKEMAVVAGQCSAARARKKQDSGLLKIKKAAGRRTRKQQRGT